MTSTRTGTRATRRDNSLMEKQGIILLRILDEPFHVLDDISLGGFRIRTLRFVSEKDDIRVIVTKSIWYQYWPSLPWYKSSKEES